MKKTVCLNMIVKDEKHVIKRCLASVKPFIDYWVIVDTGSTDGTPTIIRDFMQEIPGELHVRPWVNFGHNRNEALTLARGKGDYFLFIDADDRLVAEKGFKFPDLLLDYYLVVRKGKTKDGDFYAYTHNALLLIKDLPEYQYAGVLHEVLQYCEPKSGGLIYGIINEYLQDGCRSQDPDKFHKEAIILENALRENPNDARYRFYLAEAYHKAGKYDLALENFEKRASMGGEKREVFNSLLQMGEIQECLNLPCHTFFTSYCKAFQHSPHRAEPLYKMANYFSNKGNYILGYAVAKQGLALPLPEQELCVVEAVYDYGLLCTFAECAFQLGREKQARKALQKVLAKSHIAPSVREHVQKQLATMRAS